MTKPPIAQARPGLLRRLTRLLFPDDVAAQQDRLARRTRNELRGLLRKYRNSPRFPKVILWVSTDLLQAGDRAESLSYLSTVSREYAEELASELGAASPSIVVREIATARDTVVAQALKANPLRTVPMPRRISSVEQPSTRKLAKKWLFEVISGDARGTTLSLPHEGVIGRMAGEGVIELASPRVSRRHLSFRIQSSGLAEVCELGSRNGSTVNMIALKPGDWTPIKPGSRLGVGDISLVCKGPSYD